MTNIRIFIYNHTEIIEMLTIAISFCTIYKYFLLNANRSSKHSIFLSVMLFCINKMFVRVRKIINS